MDTNRLGIDISDCCNYLDSNKVTERKKRVTELKQLLENPRSFDLLNDNSDKDRGLCWDNVFLALHRCLLKEIKRVLEDEKAKGKLQPRTENTISTCCGLLVMVVSKANTGTRRISCSELFSCILEILEEYIGNTNVIFITESYITLLKHALSCEHYWGEIEFNIWKALLEICIYLLKEDLSEKIKATIISITTVIVLQGGKMSSLTLKSKTLLVLFPEIFTALLTSRYPRVELWGIKLSHTLCIQFSMEFSLSIDKFMDQMLPYIMKSNDNRPSSETNFKELMSNLLIEIVNFKTTKPDWQNEAESLVSFVNKELADISKHKLLFSNTPKVIILGVKLSKYLFKENYVKNDFHDNEPKRRKTISSVGSILDNISKYKYCSWPWLCYLDCLLEMAPEVVLDEDIVLLIDYFSFSLVHLNDPESLQYMTGSSLRVMNISQGRIAEKNRQDFLSILWATAIRCATHSSLANKGFGLISGLLANKEWIIPDSASVIFKLYVDRKIEVTIMSLKTLSDLCSIGIVLEHRTKLVSWCLSGEVYSTHTLLCLLMKSKFYLPQQSYHSKFPLSENQRFLIISSLGRISQEKLSCNQVTFEEVIEDTYVTREFIKLLPKTLSETNSLEQSLKLNTSLLSLLASLKEYNATIISSLTENLLKSVPKLLLQVQESIQNTTMTNPLLLFTLTTNFFKELSKIPSLFITRDSSQDLIDVLIRMLKYHHNLNCEIDEKASIRLIDVEYNLEKLDDEEPSVRILGVIIALTDSYTMEEKIDAYNCLLEFCKSNLSLRSKSGFNVLKNLLQHILHFGILSKTLIKNVVSLTTKLCNNWFTYYVEVIQILQIIFDSIKPILKYDSTGESKNLIYRLLSSFLKHIGKKKYGPAIIRKYVSILSHICECDPEGIHRIELETGQKQNILCIIIEFLNSPFHQVRIEVSDQIEVLFKGEILTAERHSLLANAFNNILSIITNLFLVKEGKSPDEVREEALNRINCVLKIYLGLICSSPLWRRKALYELFNTVAMKNISYIHFDKFHYYLEKNMGVENSLSFFEQNMDYILWEWYKNHKSFERVPFFILKYGQLKDFYVEYKQIIVPIFLLSLDIDGFNSFCLCTDSTPLDIASECFPEILSCLITQIDTNDESAEELHKYISKILGTKIKELLSSEMKEVLLNLFMKLSDGEYYNKLCGQCAALLPSNTPFNVTSKGIESALSYVQRRTPNQDEILLSFLCNNYPKYIQYLMHNLLSHVHLASTKEIRSLCFLQYIALIDGLVTELPRVNTMSGFIVRHAIHSLLYFIDTDINMPALQYMYRFLEILLHTSAELIDYFIGIVYPNLLRLSHGNDPLALIADKTTKLLLEFKDDLPKLHPLLPPKETLGSLTEEINIFLQMQTIDCHALKRLLSQLTERRDELSSIYEVVKSSRYSSEDCATSPLHRLISKLVIVTSYSDSQLRAAATDCLGRIGPRSLNTLALQPELVKEPTSLIMKIISLLLPLLVSNDMEICEMVVTATSELFETKQGMEAFEELDKYKKSFLSPFCNRNKNLKNFPKDYNYQKLVWASMRKLTDDQSKGWALWSGSDYSKWIRMLVSRLLDSFNSGVLPLLAPIAAKIVEFSEELLPYIIEILIDDSNDCSVGLVIVQKNISLFFENHYKLHFEKNKEGYPIYSDRKSVLCMLSIVNFCRVKTASSTQEQWMDCLRKLKVNFLYVAHAAQYCRAYFTSLLYTEIWTEFMKEDMEEELPVYTSLTPLDMICRLRPEEGYVTLNLLWENYKEIGEIDSVESCARLLIGDRSSRMRYFKEMGLWHKLVAEAEIHDNKEALSHGLLMSGLFTSASRVEGYGWEAAWRLMDWDIEQIQKADEDFSSLHYSALKASLKFKDKQGTVNFLELAKKLVVGDLAHASLEVAASVYLPLAKLQLVSELERWCKVDEVDKYVPDAEWVHLEPILQQRVLLWGGAEEWLTTAKIARENSSHLIAQRLLKKLKSSEVHIDLQNEAKFEEALIQWESGTSEAGKFVLKSLLANTKNPILKSKCLLKYGTWMSETKSQNAKEIIEEYFEKAAELIKSHSCNESERLEATKCLAKFSDNEFQRLQYYLSSSEYENKISQMKDSRENLKAFQSCSSTLNIEERKSSKIHQCNLAMDKAEIETIRNEHAAFLRLAIREYLFCLQYDATTCDKMYRFVSLWLSNNRMACLREELDEHLNKVPSYRFVPVFPQLSVRMSLEVSHFSLKLTSLLERCSIDHPHHCLWHLLALANAEKDQPKTDVPPPPRVQGATKLANSLFKNSKVGKIVRTMQNLACAYISFANLELPKGVKPGESYKFSKNEKLREMNDLAFITSATVTLPISKSANYENIPGIVSVEQNFQIVGGINQPKKIKILFTDGKTRPELVKGHDDIRQDALMQQVFSVLNTLLEADSVTSRRRLNVRIYKVVPLTQKSGVIEWCSDTEPLGKYLSMAHQRYHPNGMSQAQCKLNLQNVAQSSNEEKLKVFKEICSKFEPVMRHFFLERYLTPGVWYEKKLAYTRSVATNSMIGYVLGIGDRHVFNILIDNKTAEVVHIDFGISFELGKILPTPETVPFRLTRDIEDGMGITGVEGAFRRCCEETMRVMRKKSEPIVTTLEALLYDPLYSWSVKKIKSEQSQQSIPDISMAETNKLAERFLQRLKLKLEGREEGGVTSIEAQVRNIIQEAKDPKNLSRLYRGWQAYL